MPHLNSSISPPLLLFSLSLSPSFLWHRKPKPKPDGITKKNHAWKTPPTSRWRTAAWRYCPGWACCAPRPTASGASWRKSSSPPLAPPRPLATPWPPPPPAQRRRKRKEKRDRRWQQEGKEEEEGLLRPRGLPALRPAETALGQMEEEELEVLRFLALLLPSLCRTTTSNRSRRCRRRGTAACSA